MVWQETSIVELDSTFASVCGSSHVTNETFYMRQNKCIRRRLVMPVDAKSPLQMDRRQCMGQISRQWGVLSEEQRLSWIDYARTRLWPEGRRTSPFLTGMNAFECVHATRLRIGLGYACQAPSDYPPPLPISISQEPTSSDDSFAFRVEHPLGAPSGYLLFELSWAMPTLRRKPRKHEIRWACEDPRGCVLPMGASGTLYTITGARYPVAEGRLYGVRVSLISLEGVPGPKLTRMFIKQG